MKKIKSLLKFEYIKIFICAAMAIMLALPFLYLKTDTLNTSIASNDEITIDASNPSYSIFINDPTFSFEYEQNLYFFDNFDKNLKVFSLQNNTFFSKYLSTKDLGTIVDATIYENYIFALFLKNDNYTIQKIVLNSDNLTAIQISSEQDLNGMAFLKIFATSFEDNYYISLTPKIDIEKNTSNNSPTPLILTLKKSENQISHVTALNIDELNPTIKNTLFKIMLIPSTTNTYFNIILTCASEIYALNLPISSISNETIHLTDTQFYRPLDTSSYDHETYAGVSLLSVNLLKLNDNYFIVITYNSTTLNGTNSAYTKFYLFNLSLFVTESTFEVKSTIPNTITKYLSASSNGISFPNNQNIEYISVSYSEEIAHSNYQISNPSIKVNYYEENNFIYVKTNQNTGLFNSPWNSTPIITIENDTDLIIIGEGEITSQNYTIEDYKYCLFTNNKNNYLGFIKTENLTQKEICTQNYNKIFTVIANTPLYSLPTKITGTVISTNLSSKVITNIQEFSKIELIDSICGYTSNSTIFIKVKVNDSEIGYIDTNQIQNKNNINIFITNNATIKLNNTDVYLNEDDKTIIATLSAGTRVQVTGTRNRKTGLTSITFSDEYGNTFCGYILSDNVKADGWTNLQMLGSIFIAINLGILVMIFYFKRKRLITKESKSIISKTDSEY